MARITKHAATDGYVSENDVMQLEGQKNVLSVLQIYVGFETA